MDKVIKNRFWPYSCQAKCIVQLFPYIKSLKTCQWQCVCWLIGRYARTMNTNTPIRRSFSSYSLQGFLFFSPSKYFKAFKAVLLVLCVFKKKFCIRTDRRTDRQRDNHFILLSTFHSNSTFNILLVFISELSKLQYNDKITVFFFFFF